MSNTTCQKFAAAFCLLLTYSALYGQVPNALSTYLNQQKLSPLPNAFSFYKPGALVIVRYNQNGQSGPDYQDPEADASEMDVDLATGILPGVDITSENHLSIAAKLFGFDPQAKFATTETLTTDQINISGYRLTTQEIKALADPTSATFRAAKTAFVRNRISLTHPLIKDTEVYIVDSVYTTTDKVKVYKKTGTQLVLSSGEDVACQTARSSDKQGTSGQKDTDAKAPKSGGQGSTGQGTTGTDSSSVPSGGSQNPTPPASGNQAVEVVNAVGSAAKNIMTASSGATGTSASTTKVKDLGKGVGYSAGVAICRDSGSTVTLSSQTPIPFALVLRRVTFVANFQSMNTTIQPVTW